VAIYGWRVCKDYAFSTLRRKYRVKELIVECDGTLRVVIESVSKVLGKVF